MEAWVTDTASQAVVSAETRLSVVSNVTLQSLGEDEGGVLLKLDTGEMYTVNDTAVAFVRELDGDRSVAAIARHLVTVFEVDEAVLVEDLAGIARELAAEKLVTVAG
jgi:hypothetical protein